jgi:hypothetical protein
MLCNADSKGFFLSVKICVTEYLRYLRTISFT